MAKTTKKTTKPAARGAKRAAPGGASAAVDLAWIHPNLRGLAVPVDTLTENPDNLRDHDARSIEVLAASLGRFGQRAPLVARAGVVLAGNGRLRAARALGWSHVAVLPVDDTVSDAEVYAMLDNRTAEIGTSWNWEGLAAALQRQVDAGQDLEMIGWKEHEAEPLLTADFSPADVSAKLAPDGSTHLTHVRPVIVTAEQREVFERAVARIRDREADPHMQEGRALELIVADYLAGPSAS